MQTMYIKGHPSVERVLSGSHDALSNVGYLVLADHLIIAFLYEDFANNSRLLFNPPK